MTAAGVRRFAVWAIAAFGLFFAGVVAARVVADETSAAADPPPPILYTVEEATLGRAVELRAQLKWTAASTTYAPNSGTITRWGASETGPLRVGDVVLWIDERPVTAIESTIPMYRDLAQGDRGLDVRALNRYLAELGYDVSARSGAFTKRTATAVRKWHQSSGLGRSAKVRAGELLGIPKDQLQSSVFMKADGIAPGMTVARGQPLLRRLTAVPEATVMLGSSVPGGLVEGTPGSATLPDGRVVPVVVAALTRGDDGQTTAMLEGPSGPICQAAQCPIPSNGNLETFVKVRLVVVPTVSGPLVPATAIQTDAAGVPFVTLPDGTRRPVVIRAAVDGEVVVGGIDAGRRIVLP